MTILYIGGSETTDSHENYVKKGACTEISVFVGDCMPSGVAFVDTPAHKFVSCYFDCDYVPSGS